MGAVASPRPPAVTVVPWAALAAWGAGTLAVLAIAGWLATRQERRPMSEAVVELRDVFCVHRTNEGDAAALAGTNLELARGEVLGVLGPSGAGKSTLLRVVAGIQEPSAGVVRVLGRDIGRMPARSRSRFRHELVGFLGQHADAALSPDLRMRDAVRLPLALRGVPRRERRRRVGELLEATALAERADALPGELSGGERQRFALCAALAHRPALLLADEPTGELDDASAGAIRALIVGLARTNGTSVILVTHDPATAEAADRTLVIRDGRIVGDRRGGEESLVVDDGWLRLPSELLTQAGIGPGKGRRARLRPAPDGVIVTRAVSDSGPAGPAVAEARPRPPGTVGPRPGRAGCRSPDLRARAHPAPGARRAHARLRARPDDRHHGPFGGGEDDAAEAGGRARPPKFGPGRARRAPARRPQPRAAREPAPGTDRIPPAGARADRVPERRGERSARPADTRLGRGSRGRTRRLGADPSRARRPGSPARQALGRGSPAAGASPGARQRAGAADRRRADLQAGREQRPGRGGSAGVRRARGGPDRALRHARPRRDRPGRPRCRPGRTRLARRRPDPGAPAASHVRGAAARAGRRASPADGPG